MLNLIWSKKEADNWFFLTSFTVFGFVSAVFHFLSTCSSRDEQPVPFPSLWMSQQYSLVLIIWKCSQRKPPRHLPPVYQHVACAQPTGRTNRAIQTRDLERGLKQFNTIRRRESRGGCSTFGKGEDHSAVSWWRKRRDMLWFYQT